MNSKGFDYTVLTLVIIGAINWGLIGFFKFDLVAFWRYELAFKNYLCNNRIMWFVLNQSIWKSLFSW